MDEPTLFQMIADAARRYSRVMTPDQVVSWDADRKFAVVIAQGEAAEKLLDHINPEESK